MLNDIARFREYIERTEGRKPPGVGRRRPLAKRDLRADGRSGPGRALGQLPAAEVFHQVLEHRWFLSEAAGKDVGIDEAVRSYVESELPQRPAERVVLDDTREGVPLAAGGREARCPPTTVHNVRHAARRIVRRSRRLVSRALRAIRRAPLGRRTGLGINTE